MKKMNIRKWLWVCLSSLLLVTGLLLMVSCTEDQPSETQLTTDAPTNPATGLPTDAPTEEAITDEGFPTVPTSEATEAPAEPGTDAPQLWAPDMGTFNEGKVEYVKEVETTILDAFPDDKLGLPLIKGEQGVHTVFHTDFSDNDASVNNSASQHANAPATAVDGKLYLPYDANSSTLTGGAWTTWSPVVGASVQDYKQVTLTAIWEIVSASNGAWMTPFWGCYVSNYAGKIPDNPGDGLWISFQKNANKITVYHPDTQSWAGGWCDIPVEDGVLEGQHEVSMVCMPDFTTYVYITPAGADAARCLATVKFEDGKIKAYNEAKEMIKESDCTTNHLTGGNFSLFVHGGGGAIVDEVAVLTASKGEVIENVTVTAIPTEGHTLGLDITNKTDLVSICYSIWFDAILGKSGGYVDNWHNITEVLAGRQEWGPVPSFHYWAKPALGYYSSSNKEVIRTHMTQLYEAGVDFIVIDLTNAGDGYMSNSSAWMSYIQTPMDAICNTIMEMRAEGKGTPYVVFWAGDSEGPLYQGLYDRYHANEAWKDCFVYWDGKPFLLTTHKTEEAFPLKDLFTTRSMWGLGVKYDEGQWSFLSVNNYGRVTNGKDGKPEQVSVAVATQETYMSEPTAHGRNGGIFWYCQWYYAFEVRPKVVGLTWWNEWTAQRYEVEPGKFIFTDNYNQEYSRDIEPMEGGHGDQYYRWLKEYIAHYKAGLDCPVLVEEGMEERAQRFLKQAQRN